MTKEVRLPVKEIAFEFSVPMSEHVNYLTTLECEHRRQDEKHLKLIILDELEMDKEYEIILGHGIRSKKAVPLDWSPYRFRGVSNQ